MNCSEFKGQVGAFALGALSDEESAAMQAHLAEPCDHDGCREAFARAARTAAALASSLAPMPPGDRAWPAIESRLGTAAPRKRAPTRLREIAAWALAAGFAGALYFVNDARTRAIARGDGAEGRLAEANHHLTEANAGLAERDRCLKELRSMKEGTLLKREAIALLEKPTTRVVALAPVAGKTSHASAILNLAERRAIVLSSSMPHVADKDFELWVIRGKDAPAPAGFMHAAGEGIEVGEIDSALLESEPAAFAVSLEPLGGGPTPTEVLMVGPLHG